MVFYFLNLGSCFLSLVFSFLNLGRQFKFSFCFSKLRKLLFTFFEYDVEFRSAKGKIRRQKEDVESVIWVHKDIIVKQIGSVTIFVSKKKQGEMNAQVRETLTRTFRLKYWL